jgi:hypothetical protein
MTIDRVDFKDGVYLGPNVCQRSVNAKDFNITANYDRRTVRIQPKAGATRWVVDVPFEMVVAMVDMAPERSEKATVRAQQQSRA